MGKIKKLLMSALACVGVLGCAAVVGSKVEAASYEYGSVSVTSTNKSGDTKKWLFNTNNPTSNTALKSGDSINGVYIELNNSGATLHKSSDNKGLNLKSDKNVFSFTNKPSDGSTLDKTIVSKSDTALAGTRGAAMYVPVPADSTGEVELLWVGNDSKRGLLFDRNTSDYLYIKSNKTAPGACVSYESSDIVTYNSGTYLKFISVDGSQTGKENKIDSVTVILSTGTYGEATTQYDVSYMDGEVTLKTEKINENEKALYTPKKYGYDFDGWYTSPELTTKADLTITANTLLYAKWIKWDEFITNPYKLSSSELSKISTGIDGATTSNIGITSIYTYMKGGAMTSTKVTLPGESESTQAPCFNTGGVLTNESNGLKVIAPANGTLTVWTGVGGGSNRSAVVSDGSSNLVNTNDASQDFIYDTVGYEPRELTYTLEVGKTYYIGGTDGMRIYYVSFEEAAPVVETVKLNYQFDNEVEKNAVRFMGTINAEDLAKVSEVKLDLTLSDGENSKTVTVSFDTVYTSITDLEGFGEAEGVYYIVLELTDLSYFREFTLNATLKVTIDGVEETATLAEAISLAVAE